MNPIIQGIQLSNQLGALQALIAACDAADPEQKDPSIRTVRTDLDAQIRRYKAELDALINLYGGHNAR